jgi:hypothetical protein
MFRRIRIGRAQRRRLQLIRRNNVADKKQTDCRDCRRSYS